MFEIKYEIFEDDIAEIQGMDIHTFIDEYNQIYGCFTLIINGIEYLPYPSPEMRLETKRIYSELILTHFEFLIDAYSELQMNNYVALKYIENPWTWLEFIRNENELLVSKLNNDNSVDSDSPLQTNIELLGNAKKEGIINEMLRWNDFETELKAKTKELLSKITTVNCHILKAKCFDRIQRFTNDSLS
ncbi:hypothetical protein ACYEXS_35400 [Paenibacillus sp. MAH-36]|uniref:Uncharacterized protein n=1 Tax=Paenibacillus violae TaxID=3077234 RepID=A0ABU3RLB3_9BACL|nr:hypothetical protein [Paenibacillus sp. PFR10]MDU0204886.1 hypothetical protein [Paenibacillus sp. PFR10]